VFGDRCQELVFLGVGLNEAELRSRLEACVLTKDEVRMLRDDPTAKLPDPFPEWRVERPAPATAAPAVEDGAA
jgi:hypothetical protein